MTSPEAPETQRPSWRAVPIGLFYIVSAPAAIGGGLLLAPLQALVALLFSPWTRFAAAPRALGLCGGALIAFAIWAATCAAWSPAATAPAQAVKVALCIVFGLGFVAMIGHAREADRRAVQIVGACCALAMIALALVEGFARMPLNYAFQPHAEAGTLARNPAKGVAILVCWLWPALAALAGGSSLERFAWRAALVGAIAASLFFNMAANVAAIGLGLVAYILGFVLPRSGPLLIGGFWSVWLLIAPWVAPYAGRAPFLATAKESWRIRTGIWTFAAQKISEKPVLGWGLDAARTFKDRLTIDGASIAAIELHPHSASLQIWLETGGVGAGLAASALLFGAWRASRAFARQPLRAAALCASAAVIGLYWNVSFGVWQEWFIAVAFAAAGLVAALPRPVDQNPAR